MTLNGAITQLVLLSEHPMMPVIFRPAIQKVIETISELEAQPEQRWIPVTERLPEDYQDVLICGEGDFITCAQLIKGIFECGEQELYGSIDGTKVIGADTFNVLAWMPLPEAYQQKGETE